MSHELQPLLDRVDALLANLSAGQRKQLATELARTLRGSQAKRIRDNQAPDGTAFSPRKPQPGLRQRRGSLRMFRKLQRAKWLKAKGNPGEASVGFVGFANQVARVHHYGLRDRVNDRGLQARYPERPLLGLTKAELNTVESMLFSHLSR